MKGIWKQIKEKSRPFAARHGNGGNKKARRNLSGRQQSKINEQEEFVGTDTQGQSKSQKEPSMASSGLSLWIFPSGGVATKLMRDKVPSLVFHGRSIQRLASSSLEILNMLNPRIDTADELSVSYVSIAFAAFHRIYRITPDPALLFRREKLHLAELREKNYGGQEERIRHR